MIFIAPSGSQQTEVAEPCVDIATDEVVDLQVPWVVIVWNDPINLMMDVHEKGRAVVSNGPREKAEIDVFRLHEHGLWATMQQDT